MPKIKNGLIRKRKEELRAETEQESLREKHHIADRNVMIVEKGSVVRSVACIFGSTLLCLDTTCSLGGNWYSGDYLSGTTRSLVEDTPECDRYN